MKSTSMPLISVIMPVRNSISFLPETLESIFNQTEKRFEIYAINDGSTDESEAYLKSIQDERLTIISPGKIGLVKSLNLGIQYAKTQFIAICDSDDIYTNTRFEEQLNFLISKPDYNLVGSNIKYFGSSIFNKVWSIKMPSENEQIVGALIKGLSSIVHSTVMMRTEVVKSIGGYNEEYFPAPDYALFLELTNYGKMANLKSNLAYIRLHKASIMSNQLNEGLKKYEKSRLDFCRANKDLLARNKFSNITQYLFSKLRHLEFKAIVLYRMGIFNYVNNNQLKGILLIALSGLISPRRSIVFLKEKLRRL